MRCPPQKTYILICMTIFWWSTSGTIPGWPQASSRTASSLQDGLKVVNFFFSWKMRCPPKKTYTLICMTILWWLTSGSIPGWPPAASRVASRWSNFIFKVKNELPTPKNIYFDMHDHTLMNDLWIHTWTASSSLQDGLQPLGRPQGGQILFFT